MRTKGQAAIVFVCTLLLLWATTDGAVLPTTRYNGENCLNISEIECPFDHEIAKCTTNNTLVECRPCRHGYRNCVRASSLRDVKCYRPELDCEPDERSVVKELSEGGCDTRCVCLQEGYVKDSSGECVKREKCGTDMTLIDDRCSKCPVGSYKPWVGDERCIPIPTNQIPLSTTTPSQELDNSNEENQTKIVKGPAEITVTDVQALSSTEVYLQWKRPGTMCNYTVVYRPEPLDLPAEKQKNLFNKDAIVNMTLQELQPATSYKAYIIASDSKQHIKSPYFIIKTKDEGFDGGGTSNTSVWSIIGVVIGICTFLLLSLFIIGYVYRKCRRRREPTRGDALGDPPPYEEAVHNNDELNNVPEEEEEGVGHEGEEDEEEGHEGDPPPPPPPAGGDQEISNPTPPQFDPPTDRNFIPGPEFSTISSATSNQPISNDPDETNLKERHSHGSSHSNETVSLSSNGGVFRRGFDNPMPQRIDSSTALLPRFDSQSTVLPPEDESERPHVTDPLIPPSGQAAANRGQSSIDLANQDQASFHSRPSVNLRSPRGDSTSSQTIPKKKPGVFVAVPTSRDNHDPNTNTDLKH